MANVWTDRRYQVHYLPTTWMINISFLHEIKSYTCFSTLQIQMLQCIKQVQSAGGENIMTDGFYVANVLREKNPVAMESNQTGNEISLITHYVMSYRCRCFTV